MDAATVTTLLEIPSADPASYCRLCLSSSSVEPLFPESFHQDLLELIAKNVQVVLDVEEDLPCAVCRCCRERLEEFERFRDQCRKLDELLRNRRRELELLREVIVPEVVMEVSEEVAVKLEVEDDGLPYVVMEDGWNRCKFCSEAFQSLSVLVEHFRMRHPEESRVYKCPSCLRTYSSQMGGEVAVGTSSPAYKCDECDARFGHRVGLARHRDRYHESSSPSYTTERVKCERCPAVFVNEKQRARHQLQVHVVGDQSATKQDAKIEGIHVCEKCAVTFSPYQALLVHIQEHHWNDPPQESSSFSCNVCAKPFDKRRLLQYHILVAHLGQIPYACNHCGEWFRTKSHLKQHKNMFHEQRASGVGTGTTDVGRCEFCGRTLDEDGGGQQKLSNSVVSSHLSSIARLRLLLLLFGM